MLFVYASLCSSLSGRAEPDHRCRGPLTRPRFITISFLVATPLEFASDAPLTGIRHNAAATVLPDFGAQDRGRHPMSGTLFFRLDLQIVFDPFDSGNLAGKLFGALLLLRWLDNAVERNNLIGGIDVN